MKKIVLTLAATILMSSAALAQDDKQIQPQRTHKRPNKTEMAQRRTEDMAQRYGLNEKQTAQLLKLNTDFAGTLGPRHGGPRPAGGPRPDFRHKGQKPNGPEAGPGAPQMKPQPPVDGKEASGLSDVEKQRAAMQKFRKKMAENVKAYDAELKKIMTAEQFKQYEADKAKRRNHHHKR